MSGWQSGLRLLACCGLLVFLGGCQPTAETKPTEESAAAKTDGSADATKKKKVTPGISFPVREKLDGWVGNWVLLLHEQQKDFAVGVFRLGKAEDGQITAEVIENTAVIAGLELVSASGDDRQLGMKLNTKLGPGSLQLTLGEATARGNYLFGEQGIGLNAATLVPVEFGTMKDYPNPVPSEGIDLLNKALKGTQPVNDIMAFARENPSLPLALDAYLGTVSRIGKDPALKFDEETFNEFASDYKKVAEQWGPRMVNRATLNCGLHLVIGGQLPTLGLDYLNAAEAELPPEAIAFRNQLGDAKDAGRTQMAFLDIGSSNAEVAAQSYQTLKDVQAKQTFNPIIMDRMASYEVRQKDFNAAIDHLSEIVSLPLLEQMVLQERAGQLPGTPTPRELLVELWKDHRQDTPPLDEHLTAVYQNQLKALATRAISENPPVTDLPAGHRVALVEVFTGATCPPCVAADIASGVVREAYPAEQAVVLQYHQHVPGPDPLCNLDSEDRFTYYGLEGTPSVVIGGKLLPGASGYLQHSEVAFKQMKFGIDQTIKQTSPITLTASASAADGQLVIDLVAIGFSQDEQPSLRLRAALAENSLEMLAPNGIRQHEMVVRAMVGGQKGTGVKNGELKSNITLPLKELKGELVNYLTKFETGRNLQFPVKPLKLQPLTLVAWVQNEKTKEVLQAIAVPVTGELVYPTDSEAVSPDGSLPAPTSEAPGGSVPAKEATNEPAAAEPATPPAAEAAPADTSPATEPAKPE
jgi:hypothetical protein